MNIQKIFDINARKVINGELTLKEAWTIWDETNNQELKILLKRCDWTRTNQGRLLNEFKTDIKIHTKKENFILTKIVEDLIKNGLEVSWRDTGVDNKGKFQERGNFTQADIELFITKNGVKKQGFYDIKTSPVVHKCTFKYYELKRYINNKINILLAYGVGKPNSKGVLENYNNGYYALLDNSKIKKLAELPVYKEPTFGNKLCVQLDPRNQNIFKSKKFS